MSWLSDPASNAEVVVPSDFAKLGPASRAIYVGTTGDLTVEMLGGQEVTFQNCPVGWYPIRVVRVLSTGTGAQDIVAVW
jgi:hypothetical protein